jgi:hypothetical protein
VTRTDIKNYCREVWKFEVSRGWVDSFISRHSAELAEKKSSPHEEPCLQVPRIFLEETIRNMQETLQRYPADVVFNLDEVGISDWEDRKPKRVVIPVTVSAQCSQHSPSNISERETHFDCELHLRGWRVSYSTGGYISGFCGPSPGSRDNRDADCEAVDLETPRQT